MNVKYKSHADKDGIVKPFVRARQKCNECGKPIKPLFQPTRNPEDWLWLDCHTCLRRFCEDCRDVTAEGVTECRSAIRHGWCGKNLAPLPNSRGRIYDSGN